MEHQPRYLRRERAFGVTGSTSFTDAYTCQPNQDECAIFDAKTTKLVGSLTDGLSSPQGATVDAKANLYVANTGGQNVLVYAPGSSSPTETLSDPAEDPGDVAVRGSVVAVSNVSGYSGSPGSLSIYVNGATSPSYTLTDPNANEGIGVAFDGLGDCVWSFSSSSNEGMIDVFPGCLQGASPINVGAIGSAGGVAFDNDGNMIASDQKAAAVYRYSLLGPSETTINPGFCSPLFLNFNVKFDQIAVADPCAGYTWRLNWPSGKSTGRYDAGSGSEPVGVAFGPAPATVAGTTGAWHLAVMQSVFENWSAIIKATGLASEPSSAELLPVMLEAAQKVPTVPADVKTLMPVLVAQYQIYQSQQLSQACENALQTFESKAPNFPNIGAVIAYFKKAENESNSCSGWADGIAAGLAVIEDGKSTIYNSKWFAAHFNEYGSAGKHVRPDSFWKTLKKLLLGDAIGAAGGALGGIPGGPAGVGFGAAGGAVAGTLAEGAMLLGWL
jgi:hypothetical protein